MSLRLTSITALAAAALVTIAAPMAAQAASDAPSACFHTRDWLGSSALDDETVLLRVGRDVYSVGVSGGARELNAPGTYLISINRTSGSVCRATDLDLRIADSAIGMRTPLFAKTLTKLTPAEVAAIPKKNLP